MLKSPSPATWRPICGRLAPSPGVVPLRRASHTGMSTATLNGSTAMATKCLRNQSITSRIALTGSGHAPI